ncbi:MAG TPA: BTAD domain-containing putative transcriptional regulator, partial [Streptosporangiaceae bacterium]
EALASYRELAEQLAGELGLDPSPELTALQHAILTQDPALAARTRPAAGDGPPRTNLPAPLTSLIGRADAVTEVRALLASGRLVTLTGPGGVGKTRLAVEIATSQQDFFPNGVWLAELAAAGQAGGQSGEPDGRAAPHSTAAQADVTELVSAALGIRDDDAAGAPAARLAAALRTRQMLLVLDNCEHVIGPAARLAEQLLAAAPGLRIVATSQEPLAIRGEQLYEVPPLQLPEGTELEALAQAAAVQLFAARAAAAAPGFALDADNTDAVAVICRRLDGMPLALELAAARVRGLGVHALADRLDDRFRLLAAATHTGPTRQQTLRAVIDWSWDLATEPEHIVLRRLAVHAEGCTLAAAEFVCAGRGVDRADVAGLLARLVDRSLVTVTQGADGPRYRLLESVAAYGAERLREAGETDRAQLRHREFYTALAEQARPQLRGHRQRQWLERLDRETANVHSALDGAVRRGEAHLALRLAGAMTWYWFLRGRLTEASRVLAAALATGADEPGAERAYALAWQAGITLLAGGGAGAAGGGDLTGAAGSAGAAADPAERARAALTMYDGVDDLRGRAEAEWLLGFAASDFGDPALGEDLVDRALTAFRALGDRWGMAAALSTRAKLAAIRGAQASVRDDGEQSLSLFRELGDGWGQLQATEWLGALCETAGDYEQGRRLHTEGLALATDLGLWPQAADRLSWLGRIAMLLGDYEQARELLEHA